MKKRIVFTIVCCALMASLFTPVWEQRAGSAANAEPAGAEPAGTQPKPSVVFENNGTSHISTARKPIFPDW